ncbi:[citrate (pro-3S)-lyase] ligase [Serratia aquatilis]|uniref:[Citrate [pro-3S]-lyase] ligase n=1 Tax=Serratia aquatilis TaxID=1737515 RepID=A0ABV6E8C4_9GAMM
MFSEEFIFKQIPRSAHQDIAVIQQFLRNNGLNIDTSVDVFIRVMRHGELVACGGIAGNIIKCVAIDPSLRGEGVALMLATELVNLAYQRGHTQLFIYTKTQNEALFRQCGFFPLASVPGTVVLMENSRCRLARYCEQLAQLRQPGKRIGSIVMNANPFTLGHQYLIEEAARRCEWLHLFLVKEDASLFSYEQRLAMARLGTRHISNLTLHQGSQYLISRATFPCYFIKDRRVVNDCYSEIDLKLFRQFLAPALGITHRFVGEEPNCAVTAKYNHDMAYWLQTPDFPAPVLTVRELPRLCYQERAISASWVRQLWAQNDTERLPHLLPESTLHFLQQHPAKGQRISKQTTTLMVGEP